MAKKKTDKPVDLNTEILRQIRDGITQLETRLSGRIDALREDLGARINATNAHLVVLGDKIEAVELRVDRLERRMTETELRLGTQHAEVLGALEKLQETLADGFARDQAIEDLQERVTVLETKVAAS